MPDITITLTDDEVAAVEHYWLECCCHDSIRRATGVDDLEHRLVRAAFSGLQRGKVRRTAGHDTIAPA